MAKRPSSLNSVERRILGNIRYRARMLALQSPIPGMEVQDIEQDLILDLLRRMRWFDPTRSSLPTFADRVVANRISCLARPTARLRGDRQWLSLETEEAGTEDNPRRLFDVLADEDAVTADDVGLHVDVGRFLEGLPQSLLECCAVLLSASVTEGARENGLHRSVVYDRLARLRCRAIDAGLAIYFGGPPDTSMPAQVDGEVPPPNVAPILMVDLQPFASVRLLIGRRELRRWLVTANPGERIEYFRGFLALDAVPSSGRLSEHDRGELVAVASELRSAADDDRVHLVQRRNGPSDFSYFVEIGSAANDRAPVAGASVSA